MDIKSLNEKMNTIIKKTFMFLVYALAVFMIAYLVFYAIDANYSPVKTETAVMKTVEKSISTKVFIVRDEEYLSSSASGTIVPLIEDGQRVAEGQDIGAVFSNDKEAEKYVELAKLNEELDRFEDISQAGSVNIRDITSYNAQTDEEFLKFVSAISDEDYELSSEYAYSLRDRETSRQISLGYDVDTSDVLDSLNSRISAINVSPPEYLQADNTGYYINRTDGYEKTINYSDVNGLMPSDIEKALKSKPDESKISNVGKLVNNFNWYVVAKVERNDITDLTIGRSIKIRFLDSSSGDIKATVSAINSDSSGYVALILKCNTINPDNSQLRIENAEIILKTISGYKIPKQALRTLDGVNGVYIKRGNLVNFRRITTRYTAEDYVIVDTYEAEQARYENDIDEIEEENRIYVNQIAERRTEEPDWIIEKESINSRAKALEKSYIKLYDEVIIEGNGLYDNKIV